MEKHHNKVVSFILTLALIFGLFNYLTSSEVYAATDAWDGSISTAFSNGDGTITSPYAISSGADLAYLAQSVNAGNPYSGMHFQLINDINLDNHEWTPIGTTAGWHAFSGIFDGGNHTISNVKITNAARTSGLFGWVSGAEITDLNVTDVDITSAQPDIGGLIGSMSNCTVSGVTLTGAVQGDGNVGGLIGSVNFNGVPSPFATVISCSAVCVVSGSSVGTGGLVGYNVYGVYTSCSTDGTVNGTGQVGGLIGWNNDGRIVQSHSSSSVNASGSNAGGLVGSNSYFGITPEIISCYATGDVSGGSSAIGGLVGLNSSARILKSYATGTVSGTSNVGGLAGSHQNSGAEIQSCYATGAILSGSGAGSLIGNAFQAEVVSSYAIGAVYPAATNAGGLVGINSFSTVAGCFWDTETTGKNTAFAFGPDGENIGTGTAILTAGSTIYEAAGWDFAGTWQMGTGGYLYPVFGSGSTPVDPGNTPGGSSNSSSRNTGTPVLINGSQIMSVTVTNETVGDLQFKVLKPDPAKLESSIMNAKDHSEILIAYSGFADSIAGVLNGRIIQQMADKSMNFGLELNGNRYIVPVNALDIKGIASELNAANDMSGMQIRLEVISPKTEEIKEIGSMFLKQNINIVLPAEELNLIAENISTGKKIILKPLLDYIQNVVEIPDDIDPYKISTAVMYDKNGSFTHVPTKIMGENGKYYAVANSRTKGVLLFVSGEASFLDVEKHWSKGPVNEMGSRLIVNGVGKNTFAPDKEITRAEFSAIMVRALGLSPESGQSDFEDVPQGAWYKSYIETAVAAGILKGYGDGTARPMNLITREEAMAIVSRAMNITSLDASLETGEALLLLSAYNDADRTSGWAKADVASCIKKDIITGSNGYLNPKEDITRAQVAVIVERLLRKSGLI